MKKLSLYKIILLLTAMIFAVPALAQDKGEVSLPWNEFKNLTNIDKNMIVIPIETFEKLIIQTGRQDYKAQNIAGGNVILSQAEFKKIVDSMKAPTGTSITPPFNYLITKAVYKGKMHQENTDFTATFLVHILKDDQYHKIPIIPSSTAVADIRVNNQPALIVSESGFSNIVLHGKGEFRVDATFSVKSSLARGPYELALNINRTPITLLELEIPMPQIEVEIPQARQVSSSERNNVTNISAVITESSAINVRWRKKFEVVEKLPPKVYADINHLVSIEDNALKTTSQVNYNILHSEIETVGITIDDNVRILNITGSGVGEWQEIVRDEVRQIIIPFTYGIKGNVTVNIVSEVPLSAEGLETAFTGIKSLNTVRETGSIGIELNTSAEVVITESSGLERVAPQTLPNQILTRSSRPLIEGFKYSRHPYQLMLDIRKHRKVGVPMAAAYSASAVTLFTEDGKIIHSIEYRIKNSSKQFLEIALPENAQVFSVFVNNNPVESSLNDRNSLLVPLIRSDLSSRADDTYPVEIIYAVSSKHFGIFGTKSTALPAIDLFTSQIMWSVYLPHGYQYIYFDSSLEKEELIRGFNILGGDQRTYDAEIQADGLADSDRVRAGRAAKAEMSMSEFRSAPMVAEDQIMQIRREQEFGATLDKISAPSASAISTTTGLMPIRIRIPTSGQVYRFAKTVVNPEDPLTMEVYFIQSWVPKAVKWTVWILVILIIILLRRKLFRFARKLALGKPRRSENDAEEEKTVFFDDKGKEITKNDE